MTGRYKIVSGSLYDDYDHMTLCPYYLTVGMAPSGEIYGKLELDKRAGYLKAVSVNPGQRLIRLCVGPRHSVDDPWTGGGIVIQLTITFVSNDLIQGRVYGCRSDIGVDLAGRRDASDIPNPTDVSHWEERYKAWGNGESEGTREHYTSDEDSVSEGIENDEATLVDSEDSASENR